MTDMPQVPCPYGDKGTVDLAYYLSHAADMHAHNNMADEAKLFHAAANGYGEKGVQKMSANPEITKDQRIENAICGRCDGEGGRSEITNVPWRTSKALGFGYWVCQECNGAGIKRECVENG